MSRQRWYNGGSIAGIESTTVTTYRPAGDASLCRTFSTNGKIVLMKISAFNWLALSFFGYFCAYGVFVPFFPVWLKSQAYGEELIGLVIASSYVFRFIGGIFFSSLVKKPHN